MAVHAVNISEALRVPVVLLTEKDMVVGKRTVDMDSLRLPEPRSRALYDGDPDAFGTYENLNSLETPLFRPLADPEVQLRVTASTHDARGSICGFNERVRRNTERLLIREHLELLPSCTLDRQEGAVDLVLSYGFANYAARSAVARLRAKGQKVSHLTVRTIYPVLAAEIREALEGIRRLVIPEENLTGQYRRVLLGEGALSGLPVEAVVSLDVMGRSITPEEIERAVLGEEVEG